MRGWSRRLPRTALPLALVLATGLIAGAGPSNGPRTDGQPQSPRVETVPQAGGPWGGRLDRLLHNPRERTRNAINAYQDQRYDEAAAFARAARELAPDEPLTGFNAGTAELASGLPAEAIVSLQETVERLRIPQVAEGLRQPPESRFRQPRLAASALYNLGNAYFSEGDPASAVSAYEDALRLAPGHEDAKYNLELALRELERQTPPPQPRQDPAEGEGEGEQPPEPEQQGPEDGQDQEPSDADPQPRDSPLEDFQDKPDMTAEEAAAILEAVENLERQQRREEASERARSSARGEKDW